MFTYRIKHFEDVKTREDVEFFRILQSGKFHCKDINKDYIHSISGRSTFLCKACELGSLELVKWLLHQGAEINRKDLELGNTPLIWAAISSQRNIVKLLIRKGACIYHKNNNGKDVFYYAFHDGKLQIPELLTVKESHVQCIPKSPFKSLRRITNHGNPRNTVLFGDAPIHEAIRCGNITIVKRLLENGYDINSINDFNETALHIAVTKRKLSLIKFLLKKQADVNIQDIDGNTPLHVVMTKYSHHTNEDCIISLLLKYKADVSMSNIVGDTAFDVAFNNGQEQLIKLLVKNIKAKDSFHLLILAIKYMKVQLIEIIFRKFSNVKGRTDGHGNSALHYAISNEKYDIARLLVEHIDVNLQNDEGCTALHLAVEKKQNEIVGLLLSSNANVDLQNTKGESPLHVSVSSNLLIFILLVDRCDVSLQSYDGDTVLHRAAINDESTYIPMIMQSKTMVDEGDGVNEDLNFIDTQNKKGDTALHCACREDNFDAVLKLLDFNANQYITNEAAQTCVDIADEMNLKSIQRLLLDDINNLEKTLGNDTCLHCKDTLPISAYTYQCDAGHTYCCTCSEIIHECVACGANEITRIANLQNRFSSRQMSIKEPGTRDSFEAMFVLK